MRPKHLFVLIHIRYKGKAGTIKSQIQFPLIKSFYWSLKHFIVNEMG